MLKVAPILILKVSSNPKRLNIVCMAAIHDIIITINAMADTWNRDGERHALAVVGVISM